MQPKYEQIKADITEQISTGVLAAGARMKSEVQLAQDYDVSTITIRRALAELVAEGRITRTRGSGTFVAQRQEMPVASVHKKKPLIAMMLTQESYPLLSVSRIVSGCQKALTQHGCTLLVDGNSAEPKISRDSLERMLDQGVDGFLIYPFDPVQNRAEFQLLNEREKPYVLIDRRDHQFPSHFVGSNNFDGGRLATEALLKLGHTKICFCGNLFFLSSEQERFGGFQTAMYAAGHTLHSDNFMEKPDFDLAAERVRSGCVTALFCASDRFASRMIAALQARGLQVPRDVSVFGFDFYDGVFFSNTSIRLSTIRQNFEFMGQQAAELLLRQLSQPEKMPPLCIETDVNVILRESTRAL